MTQTSSGAQGAQAAEPAKPATKGKVPSPSETKATMGRMLHLHHRGFETCPSIVVKAMPKGTVRVNPCIDGCEELPGSLDKRGIGKTRTYDAVAVYDALSDAEREQIRQAFWAEWPPRS